MTQDLKIPPGQTIDADRSQHRSDGPFDPGLPAQVEVIAFVDGAPSSAEVLLQFPPPVGRSAVRLTAGSPLSLADAGSFERLELWTVPDSGDDDSLRLAKARDWVQAGTDSDPAASAEGSLLLTLQGARIVWHPGRAAVIAPADRLPSVVRALIEFAFHEAELRRIEREIGASWGQLERDSALAFDCRESTASQRAELGRRFQQVVALRARLSQVTPLVHRPPVHPPTVASQAGDRLRERARVPDRLEFIDGQLEVFERVYEMCGERASELVHADRGHTLEMIIIVLLTAQILIVLVELLAGQGG